MSFLPLLPPDVDLTDFKFMPLDVARLRDSRISSVVDGDEFRAAVMLWCAAWHQRPAASLPNDDIELAKLAGYGRSVKEWKKLRNGALYGWMLCMDGRWWHPVVAEKAAEAWNSKQRQAWARECERLRKENKRRAENGQPAVGMPDQPEPIICGFPLELSDIPPESHTASAGMPLPSSVMSSGNPPENALKGQGQGQGQGESSELRSDAGVVPDPNKQLWREGLACLTRITGKQDRPLLGRLFDATGKDHARTMFLLSRCEAEKPSEPIAWLIASAKGSTETPKIATSNGRLIAGDYYLDNVAPRIADAAGMTVSETDRTMIRWLEDGIEPDQFLPIIRRIAERDDYRPPSSLAYFDKPIREAGRRVA